MLKITNQGSGGAGRTVPPFLFEGGKDGKGVKMEKMERCKEEGKPFEGEGRSYV